MGNGLGFVFKPIIAILLLIAALIFNGSDMNTGTAALSVTVPSDIDDITSSVPDATVPSIEYPDTASSNENNSDELVTTAYSYQFTRLANIYNYETKTSETVNYLYTYEIPQINLPGESIENINAEIYNELYTTLERYVINNEDNAYRSCEEISYRWMVDGDILSLVILSYAAAEYGPGSEYMVYNISISSGTVLTDEELISLIGLSESDFYEIARTVLSDSAHDTYRGNVGFEDFFYEQLEKTTSDENIEEAYPYLDENGELCMIAKAYSLVDADYYWLDFNLGV